MRPPPPGVVALVDAVLAVVRRAGMVRVAAVGLLLMQVAWFLAVPPFRASDEFDHTYRAAAVARGELAPPPSDVARGTGAIVHVPRDIVEAAGPECRRLAYTHPIDCEPGGSGDMVTVASAAGRYNPVFYVLTGVPALPFAGVTAHYVMRFTALLMCWVMLTCAISSAGRLGSSSWPVVGIAVALTPVVVFSCSMMAPNGLEMASAAAFWTALLRLLRSEARTPPAWGPLALLLVSGALLTTLRALGPLWCLLSVLCALAAVRPPWRRVGYLLWGSGRTRVVTALLVASATASAVWTLTMGSLTIGIEKVRDLTWAEKVMDVAEQVPLWVVQSIATFPTRAEAAPTFVYVAELGLLGGLLVLMRGYVRRAYSLAVLVVVVLTVAVPFAATIATYDQHGTSWQGRYTMPFAMGMVLLTTCGLDTARRQIRPDLVLLGLVAYANAQWLGAAALMGRERPDSPGAASGAWILVPTGVVVLLLATGASLLWLAATSRLPQAQLGVSTSPETRGRRDHTGERVDGGAGVHPGNSPSGA